MPDVDFQKVFNDRDFQSLSPKEKRELVSRLMDADSRFQKLPKDAREVSRHKMFTLFPDQGPSPLTSPGQQQPATARPSGPAQAAPAKAPVGGGGLSEAQREARARRGRRSASAAGAPGKMIAGAAFGSYSPGTLGMKDPIDPLELVMKPLEWIDTTATKTLLSLGIGTPAGVSRYDKVVKTLQKQGHSEDEARTMAAQRGTFLEQIAPRQLEWAENLRFPLGAIAQVGQQFVSPSNLVPMGLLGKAGKAMAAGGRAEKIGANLLRAEKGAGLTAARAGTLEKAMKAGKAGELASTAGSGLFALEAAKGGLASLADPKTLQDPNKALAAGLNLLIAGTMAGHAAGAKLPTPLKSLRKAAATAYAKRKAQTPEAGIKTFREGVESQLSSEGKSPEEVAQAAIAANAPKPTKTTKTTAAKPAKTTTTKPTKATVSPAETPKAEAAATTATTTKKAPAKAPEKPAAKTTTTTAPKAETKTTATREAKVGDRIRVTYAKQPGSLGARTAEGRIKYTRAVKDAAGNVTDTEYWFVESRPGRRPKGEGEPPGVWVRKGQFEFVETTPKPAAAKPAAAKPAAAKPAATTTTAPKEEAKTTAAAKPSAPVATATAEPTPVPPEIARAARGIMEKDAAVRSAYLSKFMEWIKEHRPEEFASYLKVLHPYQEAAKQVNEQGGAIPEEIKKPVREALQAFSRKYGGTVEKGETKDASAKKLQQKGGVGEHTGDDKGGAPAKAGRGGKSAKPAAVVSTPTETKAEVKKAEPPISEVAEIYTKAQGSEKIKARENLSAAISRLPSAVETEIYRRLNSKEVTLDDIARELAEGKIDLEKVPEKAPAATSLSGAAQTLLDKANANWAVYTDQSMPEADRETARVGMINTLTRMVEMADKDASLMEHPQFARFVILERKAQGRGEEPPTTSTEPPSAPPTTSATTPAVGKPQYQKREYGAGTTVKVGENMVVRAEARGNPKEGFKPPLAGDKVWYVERHTYDPKTGQQNIEQISTPGKGMTRQEAIAFAMEHERLRKSTEEATERARKAEERRLAAEAKAAKTPQPEGPQYHDLTHEVEKSRETLEALEKASMPALNRELKRLEALGIDTGDVDSAIEDFDMIARSDFEPGADGSEEYRGAREDAWETIKDAVSDLDATQVEVVQKESRAEKDLKKLAAQAMAEHEAKKAEAAKPAATAPAKPAPKAPAAKPAAKPAGGIKGVATEEESKARAAEFEKKMEAQGKPKAPAESTAKKPAAKKAPAAKKPPAKKLTSGIDPTGGRYDEDKPLVDLPVLIARMREALGDVPSYSERETKSTARPSQVPTPFKLIPWGKGTRNFDLGGGPGEAGTEHLKAQGVENIVVDPHNRDEVHNALALEDLRKNPADTGTSMKVLNVIRNAAVRSKHIETLGKFVKPGGKLYFYVYEGGEEKGQPGRIKPTTGTYQENRSTDSYVAEIAKYYPDAKKVAGGYIEATNTPYSLEKGTGRQPEMALSAFGMGSVNNLITKAQNAFAASWKKSKPRELAGEWMRLLSPTTGGEEGALGRSALRYSEAKRVRMGAMADVALRAFHNYFAAHPKSFGRDFVINMEKGGKQPTPQLQRIADEMRTLLDSLQTELAKRDLLHSFIPDYFPRLWKKPGASAPLDVDAFNHILAAAHNRLGGTKGALKQRTIGSIEDAYRMVDAGLLEPVFDNPADLLMNHVQDMAKAIFEHDLKEEMKKKNILQFVHEGGLPNDGWVKIRDPRWQDVTSRVPGPPRKTGPNKGKPGAPMIVKRGAYYAPEPVARLINNYLSEGMGGWGSAVKWSYRGLNRMNNFYNMFQLGLSGFHAMFMVNDAMASRLSLGLMKTKPRRGDTLSSYGKRALSGAKDIATAATILGPTFKAYKTGGVLRNELLRPMASADPEVRAMAERLLEGGGRAQMEKIYNTGGMHEMRDALSHLQRAMRETTLPARFGAVGQGVWEAFKSLPFAFSELTAYPLMEDFVPKMKLGVFSEIASYELERLGPNVTVEQRRLAMQRAVDMVDDRMGQLAYSNVGWNAAFRDMTHLLVRSVGWNLGDIRSVAGAARDITHVPRDVLSSVTGGRVRGRTAPDVTFSHRMSYLMAYGLTTMYMNYVYGILSGHPYKDRRDLLFPRNVRGIRVSYPSYAKDAAEFVSAAKFLAGGETAPMTHFLQGKASPLVTMTMELWTNKDFAGNKILRPKGRPGVDRALNLTQQLINYLLAQAVPISFRGSVRTAKVAGKAGPVGRAVGKAILGAKPRGESPREAFERMVFGVNRAPRLTAPKPMRLVPERVPSHTSKTHL